MVGQLVSQLADQFFKCGRGLTVQILRDGYSFRFQSHWTMKNVLSDLSDERYRGGTQRSLENPFLVRKELMRFFSCSHSDFANQALTARCTSPEENPQNPRSTRLCRHVRRCAPDCRLFIRIKQDQ